VSTGRRLKGTKIWSSSILLQETTKLLKHFLLYCEIGNQRSIANYCEQLQSQLPYTCSVKTYCIIFLEEQIKKHIKDSRSVAPGLQWISYDSDESCIHAQTNH
jgi:hypothetical protein